MFFDIYSHIFQRMVYPETLKLDQVSRKSSPNSGSSWSEDETSKTQETSFVRGREINSGGCKNELERNASSANSGRSSSSLYVFLISKSLVIEL